MLHLAATPRYKNRDEQVASSTTTEAVFPAVTTASNVVKPEAIFLQAYSQNGGRIVVGKTGLAADGTTGVLCELQAGNSIVLPVNDISSLYHRANTGTQKLFITYLSSVV